jgi:transketolase
VRKEFSQAIENIMARDEKVIFITGDLGYMALENLKDRFGNRFINAGVAEQNMVGMAAGMAYKGFKVFCYSIAPFAVYRCLEQFRNDACLHNLPVFVVGNGGGYGYGIMGSTHHAIEDLACLSGLQNVNCWIPAFADEVEHCVNQTVADLKPAYIRLGVGKKTPIDTVDMGAIRHIHKATTPSIAIVALGPIVANVQMALEQTNISEQIDIFTARNLPLKTDDAFFEQLAKSKIVIVAEEHVSVGGLAQQLSVQMLERGIHPQKFVSLAAKGYPDGRYGSQAFHQQQSGLSSEQIAEIIMKYEL